MVSLSSMRPQKVRGEDHTSLGIVEGNNNLPESGLLCNHRFGSSTRSSEDPSLQFGEKRFERQTILILLGVSLQILLRDLSEDVVVDRLEVIVAFFRQFLDLLPKLGALRPQPFQFAAIVLLGPIGCHLSEVSVVVGLLHGITPSSD
jgi:hypothetical protein